MPQSVLDDIRSQHIPVDFLDVFDGFQLPYYEGKENATLNQA